MNKSLRTRAPRIAIHAADQPSEDEEATDAEQAGKAFEIDWGALTKT